MANSFENKTFLFTGKLKSMKREEAEAKVAALGGKTASSVTRTLSVLVSTSETCAKWTKAQELNGKGANIQFWTEEQFMAELEKAEGKSGADAHADEKATLPNDKTKKGAKKDNFKEGTVIVRYHISEDLVNTELRFGELKFVKNVKASDVISAVYIDDQPKTTLKSTITFKEAGEHIVRIVLKDKSIIPTCLLDGADHIYSVEIPESVTEIHPMAFRWTNLQCPPTLPPHLKTIERGAFEGAYKGVDCVELPDSVEKIEHGAFEGVPHIILGKSFKEYISNLSEYDKVTVSADNPYVEIRNGFIIDKTTHTVKGLMKGTYEDAENVTIRLPDGITCIDDVREMFRNYSKASLYIPGYIERVHLSDCGCPNIEFAEGVKEISLRDAKSAIKQLPNTLKQLKLYGCNIEELSVPAGVDLDTINCSFKRLNLGAGVILSAGCFSRCKGEVFVEGPIQFESGWGGMIDGSILHVPDEATAKKIFNYPEYNKQVKIFIDGKLYAAQADGAQEKQLLSLLGCPDYPYTLHPINANRDGNALHHLTLLFNLPQKTTVNIEIISLFPLNLGWILDDGEQKKLRGKREECEYSSPTYNKFIGKIAIPKGLHIVRLINYNYSNGFDKIAIDPPCESLLISDTIPINLRTINISGIKHLILGAQCYLGEDEEKKGFPELMGWLNSKDISQPLEHISVVPNNEMLEYRDGCFIDRKTKKLLYAGPDAVRIPSDIAGFAKHAFTFYKQEHLTIPAVEASLILYGRLSGCKISSPIKELVFEEGVESIVLWNFVFPSDAVITLPKSLKELFITSITAGKMIVRSSCTLKSFLNSHIDNLEFQEKVTLRPYLWDVFSEFSGNIHFYKGVTPVENIGAPNDDCVITVPNKELADAIKNDETFNKNVKVMVK